MKRTNKVEREKPKKRRKRGIYTNTEKKWQNEKRREKSIKKKQSNG